MWGGGGGKLKRREEGRGEERERKGGGVEEDVGGRVEGREGLSAQTLTKMSDCSSDRDGYLHSFDEHSLS